MKVRFTPRETGELKGIIVADIKLGKYFTASTHSFIKGGQRIRHVIIFHYQSFQLQVEDCIIYDYDKFIVKRLLGHGTFGVVKDIVIKC